MVTSKKRLPLSIKTLELRLSIPKGPTSVSKNKNAAYDPIFDFVGPVVAEDSSGGTSRLDTCCFANVECCSLVNSFSPEISHVGDKAKHIPRMTLRGLFLAGALGRLGLPQCPIGAQGSLIGVRHMAKHWPSAIQQPLARATMLRRYLPFGQGLLQLATLPGLTR